MNPLTLLNSLPGALAQGLIWGIMAIGVAITYKILDYADLTVDNSLCTGGAVAAVCIIGGMNPLLALLCAVLAGALAGLCTGLLHTVLGIPAILSGILTQLALYSINMHIMGGKSNLTVSRTQYQLLLSSAKVPPPFWSAASLSSPSWRCCTGSSAPSWAAPSGPPVIMSTWPGPRAFPPTA